MRLSVAALCLTIAIAMGGCDMLGVESASAGAARREAEGKAVGAGCRHAARSVEQCYVMNKRADKAAVFAGWREMNDYMRENKIDAMPGVANPPAEVVAAAPNAEKDDAAPADGEARKSKSAEPREKAAAGHH
jgi:hypothetical protein